MKMINKLLYLMAFVGTLGFASCEDDTPYDPAPQVDSSKSWVYFSTEDMPSTRVVEGKQEGFSIKLTRRGAMDLFLANLKVQFEDEKIAAAVDYSPSVTFKEGAEEAEVEFIFKKDFPTCKPIRMSVSIADTDNIYEYGLSSYSFELMREVPFKSSGKGIYVDNFLSGGFGFPAEKFEVEIKESELEPNVYYVKNVYSAQGGFWNTQLGGALSQVLKPKDPKLPTLPGAVPTAEMSYIVVDCSNPQEVRIRPGETFLSLNQYFLGQTPELIPTMIGMTRDFSDKAKDAPLGKLEDGVISFPAKSIACLVGNIALLEVGAMKIVLPDTFK